MLLNLIDELDIGKPSKQRLIFEVLEDGNLWGHHLFQVKEKCYSFPSKEVSKGDYVVLYLSPGEDAIKKIANQTCHFLYLEHWLNLWEEQELNFIVKYLRKQRGHSIHYKKWPVACNKV